MPLALAALALIAFGMGIAEFVIMGLLPNVAADLGVSIPDAGLLVTAYAVGIAVGAPLLTASLARLPRKPTLLVLTGTFLAGSLCSALAPGYGALLAGRVVTAFAHGAFFAIASVLAADLVAPDRKARAIATVMAGHSVANVLGVPLGTLVGQAFGWRATFWTVAGIAAVSAAVCVALVPNVRPRGRVALRAELGVLRHRQVLLALALSVLANGGLFAFFTYIAPLAITVAGFTEAAVSWLLVLFGLGVVVGNVVAGMAADRWPMPTIYVLLGVLTVVLAATAVSSHSKLALAVTMPIFGAAAFGLTTPLQMRVVTKASNAPTVASAVNISAFNVANAGGAALGGALIASGLGYPMLGPAAAAVCALGLLLALYCGRLDRADLTSGRRASGSVV